MVVLEACILHLHQKVSPAAQVGLVPAVRL